MDDWDILSGHLNICILVLYSYIPLPFTPPPYDYVHNYYDLFACSLRLTKIIRQR